MSDLGNESAMGNGFEVVAIDRGPDVIDDGDECERCRAYRVAGESSWIVEYAHGGLKDVCSACASKLEVGSIDYIRAGGAR